jgi:DNA-binding NarL/FixJ family response regulator
MLLLLGEVANSLIKNSQFIAEARKVGAKAHVQKSDAAEELVCAIKSAAKGDDFFAV